jgi:hypothetical protein
MSCAVSLAWSLPSSTPTSCSRVVRSSCPLSWSTASASALLSPSKSPSVSACTILRSESTREGGSGTIRPWLKGTRRGPGCTSRLPGCGSACRMPRCSICSAQRRQPLRTFTQGGIPNEDIRGDGGQHQGARKGLTYRDHARGAFSFWKRTRYLHQRMTGVPCTRLYNAARVARLPVSVSTPRQ